VLDYKCLQKENYMIRHVVLFKLKSGVAAETVDEVFAALKDLQSKITGIIAISAGRDNSPEGIQRGHTHGFTVDFVDGAARDAYLPHAAHQAVGAMIVGITEGGVNGICVVDWDA
jgi:Stress responsive A/B Barrel Domain